MKNLKKTFTTFDQALAACSPLWLDPARDMQPQAAEALRTSFLELLQAFGLAVSAAAPPVCICVMETATPRAEQVLRTAALEADLLEWRLDSQEKIELENFSGLTVKPLIITIRRKEEGGFFKGTEAERLALLQTAAQMGAPYIDLEYRSPQAGRDKLIRDKGATRIILSYHDLQETPGLEKLLALLEGMLRPGAYAYKIVTTVRDPQDNLVLLHLLHEAAGRGIRLISHGMGRAGLAGRVLAPFFGSWLAYAAPQGGAKTAPGQIEARQVKKIWELLRT